MQEEESRLGKFRGYLRKHKSIYSALRSAYRAIIPPPRNPVTAYIDNQFSAREPLFFVQIGASDGVTDDPLHPIVQRNRKWSGIFIEPLGFVFEKLKKNYRYSGRFIFENVAIGMVAEKKKFYYFEEQPGNAPDGSIPFYSQLGSFDLHHLLKHADDEHAKFITSTEVDTVPLSVVLNKHHVEKIDLILIDAEGYDFQILKQIDLGVFHPKMIVFEFLHLSPGEKEQALRKLSVANYRIHELRKDIVAIRTASVD